jgi:hypothetical protein
MRFCTLWIHGFVMLTTVFVIGCFVQGNQYTNSPSTNEIKPLETTLQEQEIASDICRELSGNWRTYEIPQGKLKQICGDEPCEGEFYGGPLKLECQNGKVSGSKLLMYASHPLPGEEIRSPIESSWKSGKLLLSYVDSAKCLVTYAVLIKDKKLVGEYSVQDCIGKNWRGTHGEFLAVKSKK